MTTAEMVFLLCLISLTVIVFTIFTCLLKTSNTEKSNEKNPSYKSRFYALIYALGIFSLLYPLTNLFAHYLNQQQTLSNVAAFTHINIPFIDWAILPYSCSLLLFISGFFLVKTQLQLQRLTHRLLLATIIATLFFYWLPLTFDTENFNVKQLLTNDNSQWAWAYTLLHFFDKPYNQLPSLHVMYALLLAATLWPAVNKQMGIIGVVLLGGLSTSIALSTVFTWQHHLLDVLAGVFIAIIILGLDRHLEHKHANATKRSIIKYLVVAVSGFLLIQILPILIWNKYAIFNVLGYYWLLSFAALAATYYYQQPLVFNKKNGYHTPLTLFIFAPIILIYMLMWWVANRLTMVQIPHQQNLISINTVVSKHSAKLTQKVDILATGNPSQKTFKQLLPLLTQYQKVIWLDTGCEINTNVAIMYKNFAGKLHYVYTPMLDVTSWDSSEYEKIRAYCKQIEQHIEITKDKNSKTLIVCQCVMGWSRSVLMLTCILAYFGMDTNMIKELITKHYPKSHTNSVLNLNLLERLNKENK